MRRMRLAWFIVAISAALLTSAAADRVDEVKARGKLIVGVSDTTPPFSFKKPGESINVGYDIDMVRAVARRMGVTVETVSLSSGERRAYPTHSAGQDRLRRDFYDAHAGAPE